MPDGFQPLSREELETAVYNTRWSLSVKSRRIKSIARSALHYLARCAELERRLEREQRAADIESEMLTLRYQAAEDALRDTEVRLEGDLFLAEKARRDTEAKLAQAQEAVDNLCARSPSCLAAVSRPARLRGTESLLKRRPRA